MTESERERFERLLRRKQMEHERRKEAAEVRAALPVVTGTRTVLEKFRGEVTEDSVPYEVVVIEDGVKVYQGPPLEEEKKKGGAADGRT